jgi:hypothetical protein
MHHKTRENTYLFTHKKAICDTSKMQNTATEIAEPCK